MKYEDNIREIAGLKPDFMGFIFYPKSKRYVGELNAEFVKGVKEVEKVGVFVNELPEKVVAICNEYGFRYAQLHGKESVEDCRKVKESGIKVMKVFSVGEDFDFSVLGKYEPVADYYLFDTATEGHGGSGKKFNWNILQSYKGNKPYFLSGGIGPDDAEEIIKLKDERIFAVDINSRFEIEPGIKDPAIVKLFIKELNIKH